MYKVFNLIFSSFLFAGPSFSQYYFYDDRYYDKPILIEAGFGGGMFNCLTDLGGGTGKGILRDIEFKNFRPGGSLSIGVLIHSLVGFRFELARGSITASDNDIPTTLASGINRRHRNLHFKSNISEALLLLELYPTRFWRNENPAIDPYIVAGMGFLIFNPKALYQDKWIHLHPLRTEGQGFGEHPTKSVYSLRQFSVPVAMGLKYEISPIVNLRTEINYRFLFTDYLDDVSTSYIPPEHFYKYHDAQKAAIAIALADRRISPNPQDRKRGNPLNRDAYFSIVLRMGIIINRSRIN